MADSVEGGTRRHVLVSGRDTSADVLDRFQATEHRRYPHRRTSHVLTDINEEKMGDRSTSGLDGASSTAEDERRWWSGKNRGHGPTAFLDASRIAGQQNAHPRAPLTKTVNTSYHWSSLTMYSHRYGSLPTSIYFD